MDKGDHTGLTDFAFWVLLACILSFVFPCFPDCENPLVLVFSFPPSIPVAFIPASLSQAQPDKASILSAASERHLGGEALLQ